MKSFHNDKLTEDIFKVVKAVLKSAQKGRKPDIHKNFLGYEFIGGPKVFSLNIDSLSFRYHSEQERDEDFETLKDFISIPESKEIKHQEIEVMVKVTFVAGTELSKSELMEIAKNRIHIDLLSNVASSCLEYIQSEVHSLKEEAEIYGNEKPTKAILKTGETEGCTAESKNGVYNLTVKHGEKYDFMYDDEGNFYLIVDDRLFPETSTAFDFE